MSGNDRKIDMIRQDRYIKLNLMNSNTSILRSFLYLGKSLSLIRKKQIMFFHLIKYQDNFR